MCSIPDPDMLPKYHPLRFLEGSITLRYASSGAKWYAAYRDPLHPDTILYGIGTSRSEALRKLSDEISLRMESHEPTS